MNPFRNFVVVKVANSSPILFTSAPAIFGISNTFNCACGIVAPLLVGFLTNGTTDKATGWNFVFYITIAFYLIGAVSFLLFASAELQPWAESKFVPIDEFNCEFRREDKEGAS